MKDFDLNWLDKAINNSGRELLSISQFVRKVQTGRIENYLLILFIFGLGASALGVLLMVLR